MYTFQIARLHNIYIQHHTATHIIHVQYVIVYI